MNMRALDLAKRLPLGLEWARVNSRGAVAMTVAAALGSLLLAILARNLLSHQPLYDELLHILAARGLNSTGEPVIGQGVYDRAELFTRMVAFWFRHFGDTLAGARMPAWISAVALVAITGAWVTRRCGFIAGASAAGLLAINPWTLDLAVFARFYTLHALAVMVMFVGLYESFARDRRPNVRGWFLIAAASTAAVAWHLQITTLIAIGGAFAGVLALIALDQWKWLAWLARRYPVLVFGGLAAAIAVGIWLIFKLGLVDRLGSAPLWAKHAENSREFYNAALTRELPLLWPLMPVAFIAAFFVDRRIAIYCAVVTFVVLLVHSIAAQKAARYIYYLVPLLSVIWGCAVSKSAQLLAGLGTRLLPSTGRLATAVALGLVGIMLVNSTEGRRAARLLVGRDGAESLGYAQEADWAKAGPALAEESAQAEKVIVSNGMKAFWFLGDFDAELNASIVRETDTGEDFGIDPRTGRPAISRAESLSRLLGESSRTLVIVETEKLRLPVGVAGEVVDVLEERCARLTLPPESGIAAWNCQARLAEAGGVPVQVPSSSAEPG